MVSIFQKEFQYRKLELESLDSSSVLNLFYGYLSQLEIEAKSELTELNQLDYEESLSRFSDYDLKIQDKAQKFFYSYYFLIQEASCILDPNTLIRKFKLCRTHLKNLMSSIAVSLIVDRERILQYLANFEIRLEEKVEEIKQGSKLLSQDIAKLVSNQIKYDADAELIVLKLQGLPIPLSLLARPLNYQLKQVAQVNQEIFLKLKELLLENKDAKLQIVATENITKEELKDFMLCVNEDKELLKKLIYKEEFNEIEEEDLEDISKELALNLFYRIAWEGIEFFIL